MTNNPIAKKQIKYLFISASFKKLRIWLVGFKNDVGRHETTNSNWKSQQELLIIYKHHVPTENPPFPRIHGEETRQTGQVTAGFLHDQGRVIWATYLCSRQAFIGLRLIIGLHDLCLSGLEFKHLKEIGDRGTGTVKAVKIDLGDLVHDFEAHRAVIFHQFSQNLSFD